MYAHLVRLYYLDCIHSPYTLYDLISQVADGGVSFLVVFSKTQGPIYQNEAFFFDFRLVMLSFIK